MHRASEDDQRDDDRDVPEDGSSVRQKETAVAVQHPQTPGRKNQEARTRKQNSYQPDGDLSLLPGEPRGNQRDQCGGGQHSQQYQNRGGQREEREHRTSQSAGLLFLLAAEQPGIHRNERGGEYPLSKQVL